MHFFLLFFINQNDELLVPCVFVVSKSQIFNVQNFKCRENNLFFVNYIEMSVYLTLIAYCLVILYFDSILCGSQYTNVQHTGLSNYL